MASYQIISFHLNNGNIYNVDAIVTASNNSVTNSFVLYAPPDNTYNINSEAFATFTYAATSSVGLTSNVATVSIWVTRVWGDPQFTGETSYTIAQETSVLIYLPGYSETGSYSVEILNSVEVQIPLRSCEFY